MKKIALLTLLAVFSLAANAQPVHTLNQNFNAACATNAYPGNGWSMYNPIPSTIPFGEWACTSTDGRPNASSATTPGMTCTGVWSSSYHLDTSYLISPLLNLTSYAGEHIYLQFDIKAINIVLGGRLELGKVPDTTAFLDTAFHNASTAITPVIGNADSTNWVTHQLDMTPYIDSGNFYFAFRYTSTTAAGTAWFLDNIKLSTEALDVAKGSKDILPLKVIGKSTSSQIKLSYSIPDPGKYRIVIYDMLGRNVYDEQIIGQNGIESYNITGLNLHPGMYCVKMGNENAYGVTKLMIE